MDQITKIFLVLAFLLSSLVYSAVIPKSLNRWNQDEISVCWMKPNMDVSPDFQEGSSLFFNLFNKKNIKVSYKNNEDKKRIKNAIVDNYNKKTTAVDFVGWEDCSQDSHSDLKIIALSEIGFTPNTKMSSLDLDYFQHIRRKGFNRSQIGKQENGNFMVLLGSREDHFFKDFNLEVVALHEFGHLMGLRHEHFRKEASDDPACQHDGYLRDKVKKGNTRHKHDWKKRVFLTEYDQLSIMNECHTDNYIAYNRFVLARENNLEVGDKKIARFRKVYDQRFQDGEIYPSQLDLSSLKVILQDE